MPLSRLAPRRWTRTLKFKIVLLTVLTGVLAALGTAAVVLHSTQASITQVVLASAREDRERSASLLGSKVAVLTDTLRAVAAYMPATAWDDTAALGRYLLDKPALGALFDAVFVVDPRGQTLARVEAGRLTDILPNVADREYFQRAMAFDQPVISEALIGRVRRVPSVVIAVPVLDASGRHLGLLAGSLRLQSGPLFDELRASVHDPDQHDMVIDRRGRIVAHENPARLLQPATDEAGLAAPVGEWLASGSPIDTVGSATLRGAHLVSMAGIPLTDWVHVRVTTTARALAPVAQARRAAWPAAAGAGLAAALIAGATAFLLIRPIARLRRRAEQLLAGVEAAWPPDDGSEVGRLAEAFRHVVEQRDRQQAQVRSLLEQIEAVLDHAEVGIALTRSGRFELVSRQFCTLLGFGKEAVVGQPTRLIYPSDEAFAALAAQAGPALSGPGLLDTEVELVRAGGERFWARLRGRAVVPGDAGQGTIWTIEDISVARGHLERLAHTARHDALTGLLNRAAFEQLLDAATADAAHEPFCALFIDLDRFKQVNDTGGHAAGDALLRDVARLLAAQVRSSDTVARLGGDEFAVLLRRCDLAQARLIADKLCDAVRAYALDWEGRTHGVGASVGLVVVDASFRDAAGVLRAADVACYRAKHRGRSRVEVFDPADAEATASG